MTDVKKVRPPILSPSVHGLNKSLTTRSFWLPPVLLSAGVIVADSFSFLVGHVIAEMFTVMIAWLFFVMA